MIIAQSKETADIGIFIEAIDEEFQLRQSLPEYDGMSDGDYILLDGNLHNCKHFLSFYPKVQFNKDFNILYDIIED